MWLDWELEQEPTSWLNLLWVQTFFLKEKKEKRKKTQFDRSELGCGSSKCTKAYGNQIYAGIIEQTFPKISYTVPEVGWHWQAVVSAASNSSQVID